MSTTQSLSLASRTLEAFNRADWETFRGLCHDDVVYIESGTGRRIEGIEPYLEALRQWKVALPDVHGDVGRALADGDLAVQDVMWRGTHQGSLPTPTGPIAATGAEVTVGATLWVASRDGRVSEVTHHLDVLSLLAQIGALG
jgi:steroid delta-isomerase-like uncharacterized protein